MLASMAGALLSTVQRVENTKPVSADNLSKIAFVLSFLADFQTAPRRKLSEEETTRCMLDSQPLSRCILSVLSLAVML
jgi:hypothetical protein